jgi:anhydro-N-acetylmuramic acid kinase
MSNLYIGLMSGTSMDGIDIALCEINANSCKLLAYEEYPFPPRLKEEILELIGGLVSLKKVGEVHIRLGELFGDKVWQFLHAHKINPSDVNAIGLHGQTLWHEPYSEHPFSMQLGDANRMVARTGIQTVTDFRNMDIANGGQGAPFAPAFHQFLFSRLEGKVGVLNIGGMANLSILGEKLEGWDTGCGNVLLDMWIQKTHEKPYDKDGEFARSGEVDEDLLNKMLHDDYFKKTPPKSTGREYFNESWLASFMPIFNTIEDADIQRTLLELTAKSIANDVNTRELSQIIVCGGGAKNAFLMQRLQELCNCKVKHSQEYGVNADALEAMAFAWFAYKRIKEEVVELRSVTGAKKDSILGAIYG